MGSSSNADSLPIGRLSVFCLVLFGSDAHSMNPNELRRCTHYASPIVGKKCVFAISVSADMSRLSAHLFYWLISDITLT